MVQEEATGLSEDAPPPKDTDVNSKGKADVLVVESGPVVYSDEEEGLNEEGLNDDEMKELAYEGDPLLHSDYEEGEGRWGG